MNKLRQIVWTLGNRNRKDKTFSTHQSPTSVLSSSAMTLRVTSKKSL
jgi:hypothetical protein